MTQEPIPYQEQEDLTVILEIMVMTKELTPILGMEVPETGEENVLLLNLILCYHQTNLTDMSDLQVLRVIIASQNCITTTW